MTLRGENVVDLLASILNPASALPGGFALTARSDEVGVVDRGGDRESRPGRRTRRDGRRGGVRPLTAGSRSRADRRPDRRGRQGNFLHASYVIEDVLHRPSAPGDDEVDRVTVEHVARPLSTSSARTMPPPLIVTEERGNVHAFGLVRPRG